MDEEELGLNEKKAGLSTSIHHLRKVDPVMAQLIDRFPAPDLSPRRLAPFQSLTHAIIHQQLGSAAAGAILKRFTALFDCNAFPSPDQVVRLDVAQLCSAGLSRPKANYIHALAQNVIDGLVPTLKECDTLTNGQINDSIPISDEEAEHFCRTGEMPHWVKWAIETDSGYYPEPFDD